MKEVLIDRNSFRLHHTKQLLAHMSIIIKHAPIYNRHDVSHMCFFTSSASKYHDYTLEQIDFQL